MTPAEALEIVTDPARDRSTLVAINGNRLLVTAGGKCHSFALVSDADASPDPSQSGPAARGDEISGRPAGVRTAGVRPVASQPEPFTPNPTLNRVIENSQRFLLPLYSALPGGRIVAGLIGFTPFGVVQDADGCQSVVFALGATTTGVSPTAPIQAGPTGSMSNITPSIMFRLKLHSDPNPDHARGPVPAQLEVVTFHKLPTTVGKLSDAETWASRIGIQATKLNTRIIEAELSLEEARRDEVGGRGISTAGNDPERLYPPLALGKPERESSPVITSANFGIDRRNAAMLDGEGGYIFPDDPRHCERWGEESDGEGEDSPTPGVPTGEAKGKPEGTVSLYPED